MRTRASSAAAAPPASAPSTALALRLGVVQAGQVLSERIVPPGRRVTVGTGPDCTLVLPASSGLSKEGVLWFLGTNDGFELRLRPGQRGRVVFDGELALVESLRHHARARRVLGGAVAVPLDAAARGKLHAGDVAVLFQLVPAPPAPRGFHGIDGRAWRRRELDMVFLTALLLSALLHTGFVIWTESQPPPPRQSLDDFPKGLVSVLLPLPRLPVPQAPVATPTDPDPEPAPTADPAHEAPAPATDAGPASSPDPAPPRRSWIDVVVLGHRDAEGRGTLEDTVNAMAGLSQTAQRGLEAGAVSVTRDGEFGPRSGGSDGVAGIGNLEGVGAPQPGPGDGPEIVHDTPIRGPSITEDPPDLPQSDGAPIRATVQKVMGRIKGCYERALKQDGEMSGKVAISFLLGPDGRAHDVRVVEDTMGSPQVNQCVVQTLERTEFPPRAEEVFVPSYPFVFAPG